jgi:hypothetical protein
MTNSSSLSANTGEPDSRVKATSELTPVHHHLIFNPRLDAETAAWLAAVDLMFVEQACLFGLGP